MSAHISANNWQCISRFGWYEVEDWVFGDGHGHNCHYLLSI